MWSQFQNDAGGFRKVNDKEFVLDTEVGFGIKPDESEITQFKGQITDDGYINLNHSFGTITLLKLFRITSQAKIEEDERKAKEEKQRKMDQLAADKEIDIKKAME